MLATSEPVWYDILILFDSMLQNKFNFSFMLRLELDFGFEIRSNINRTGWIIGWMAIEFQIKHAIVEFKIKQH